MRAVFRSDASIEIGTGHVMRNLALADRLRQAGAEVRFICRRLPGDLLELISGRFGFAAHALEYEGAQLEPDWKVDADASRTVLAGLKERPDWLIADHYRLDARWEAAIRPQVRNIMVIDDLADRPHDCDLLLDQNLYRSPGDRYAGLVPADCSMLVGPAYALLREDFPAERAKRRKKDGTRGRVLIFFGGSDPGDETSKALEAFRRLRQEDPRLEADVVVGASNPHRENVERSCRAIPGVAFHCQIPNMAELMANADIAMGAGGTTTWERCCVGLPALAAILAENQRELLENAHAQGVLLNLGWAETLSPENYVRAFRSLDRGSLLEMEKKSLELVDGRGRQRVTEEMLQRRGD